MEYDILESGSGSRSKGASKIILINCCVYFEGLNWCGKSLAIDVLNTIFIYIRICSSSQQNTIKYGGNTALNITYTVYTVYTVNTAEYASTTHTA